MSTVTKPQTPGAPTRPTVRTGPAKKEMTLLFGRENYILMIAGVLLIFIGFMLMSGGKSPDPHKFNYDEVYSFRRITLAPITILLGFVIEVFAIMRKPKETATETAQ